MQQRRQRTSAAAAGVQVKQCDSATLSLVISEMREWGERTDCFDDLIKQIEYVVSDECDVLVCE